MENDAGRLAQKKSAASSRADKGLEIFFVNEKGHFEKQLLKYSHSAADPLTLPHTIICYAGGNNRDRPNLRCFSPAIGVAIAQRRSVDTPPPPISIPAESPNRQGLTRISASFQISQYFIA
ncbi:hypothetical protein [Paraburkholderia sacchari]|uniref:Uncharacterized protein n=1 Tax=Paraburkholderia sacchari TaxID=159450 RepID=A0A8T6ZC84_9BURK|nr:hypothetical protein [Paraburkholderia sacchari]NLP62328.1 hypothetical protein [Paraburkholderia sacchari]